eukprot:TRINITY_DN22730_c1_g2_i2.p1 TRINITY_DN22730_c1_g2~~TRINITY_DN22730_c1_g2_i2.p1  ORF type:complete len:1010 (+),score=265.99 TRINITY_DN22730_c1_g2_i2:142-3030(+)
MGQAVQLGGGYVAKPILEPLADSQQSAVPTINYAPQPVGSGCGCGALQFQPQQRAGVSDSMYDGATTVNQSSGFLQCACGNLFLDDHSKFCRKCGAPRSIAEALLALECDEALFVDELRKLPGGEDALRWLRKEFHEGENPGESGNAALAQIKASIQLAKQKAQEQAQEQKRMASTLRKSADDAREMALQAAMEDRKAEMEHAMLAKQAESARGAHEKAHSELTRLQAVAEQAARDADAAQAAWQEAHNHAQQTVSYHAHISFQAAQAKQAAPRGLQVQVHQRDLQHQSLQHAQNAELARAAAEAAAKKAADKLAEANQLEEAHRPEALQAKSSITTTTQNQVAEASRARGHADRLRKKADLLKAQAQEMLRDAEYAEQQALQAEQHAAVQQQMADEMLENAPELTTRSLDIGHGLSPEEVRRKIQEARAAALQAQQEAQMHASQAQRFDESARQAGEAAGSLDKEVEASDSAQNFEEAEANAALAAQQAKAQADAAAAAANAAIEHARGCHGRLTAAQQVVAQCGQHADHSATREREAWAKRFGRQDGKCGVCGSAVPENSPSCPKCGQPRGGIQEVEGAGSESEREMARAAQMAEEAQKAQAAAMKAEADAKKLELMVQALERAKSLEERLRPTKCECGATFPEDANFCRECGRPRMQNWTWDSFNTKHQHVYGGAASQVNQETVQALNDIGTLKNLANAPVSTVGFAPAAGAGANTGPLLTASPPLVHRGLSGLRPLQPSGGVQQMPASAGLASPAGSQVFGCASPPRMMTAPPPGTAPAPFGEHVMRCASPAVMRCASPPRTALAPPQAVLGSVPPPAEARGIMMQTSQADQRSASPVPLGALAGAPAAVTMQVAASPVMMQADQRAASPVPLRPYGSLAVAPGTAPAPVTMQVAATPVVVQGAPLAAPGVAPMQVQVPGAYAMQTSPAQAYGAFNAIDANGDGVISRAEFNAAMAMR